MCASIIIDARKVARNNDVVTLGVVSVLGHAPHGSSFFVLHNSDTAALAQEIVDTVRRVAPFAVRVRCAQLDDLIDATEGRATFMVDAGSVVLSTIMPHLHDAVSVHEALRSAYEGLSRSHVSMHDVAAWNHSGLPLLKQSDDCLHLDLSEPGAIDRLLSEADYETAQAFGIVDEQAMCLRLLLAALTAAPPVAVLNCRLHAYATPIRDDEGCVTPSPQHAVLSIPAHVQELVCGSAKALASVRQCIGIQKEALHKVILITGGMGFIGSHVTEAIARRMPHSRIVVLDKHTYAANVRNLRNVCALERFSLECIDLADAERVRACLKKHRPSMVLHLAAESHVDKSFGNSLEFTKSNVYGTHVLLEACRHVGSVSRFVHMSTDEVYGAGEQFRSQDLESRNDVVGHHPETSLLLPTNPYSASKAAAEMQCQAYMKSFNMPIVIVRCNNVYGPKQFPEKAIPRFTLQLIANQKCTIHGSGQSVRSFMHVHDASNAFVCIALAAQVGDVINIESKDEYSVLQLARAVRQVCGSSSELGAREDEDFIAFVTDRVFNDLRYCIDGRDLLRLGWRPRVSFSDGLRQTVKWYTRNAMNWFLPCDIMSAVYTSGHGDRNDEKHRGEAHPPAAPVAAQARSGAAAAARRVLLYGGTGWVGPQFAELLRTTSGLQIVRGRARMENTADLYNEIINSNADHVVNAAGITGRPNIDWCESNVLTTVAVNFEGAVTLALICARLDKHLTNFATGCIYTYDDCAGQVEPLPRDQSTRHAMTERDAPNFTGSVYSRVKAHAECVQSTMLESVLVLRLRMPLNADLDHGRNLIRKLLNYSTVISTRNSVSSLPTLLPVAAHMLVHRHTGIYNFTNPGHISPSEILHMYKQLVDPEHSWQEVTAQQLEASGKILARRSNCYLSSDKLQDYCAKHDLPPVPNAHDACYDCVFSYAQNLLNERASQPS